MTPETASGFKTLYTAAFRPATLDLKTKELIAVACGVSRLCEGCIIHHVKAAKSADTAPPQRPPSTSGRAPTRSRRQCAAAATSCLNPPVWMNP